MQAYLFGVLITFFMYLIFSKNKNIQYVMTALPLCVISAIRYDVGTDYFYRYVPIYRALWNGYDVENLEIGFKLFIKLLINFTSDYQILFIITSIVIVYGIIGIIFKYSKKPIISIVLFFLLGYYFESMNLVRQYMALSLSMIAFDKMMEKKHFQYIIYTFIATSIHNVAIVSVFYILLSKIKLLKPNHLGCFIVVIIIFKNIFLNIIIFLLNNTRFLNYENTKYFESDLPILLLILNIAIYFVLYYFMLVKKEKLSKEEKIFLNLQFFSIVTCLLGDIMMIFIRIICFV